MSTKSYSAHWSLLREFEFHEPLACRQHRRIVATIFQHTSQAPVGQQVYSTADAMQRVCDWLQSTSGKSQDCSLLQLQTHIASSAEIDESLREHHALSIRVTNYHQTVRANAYEYHSQLSRSSLPPRQGVLGEKEKGETNDGGGNSKPVPM